MRRVYLKLAVSGVFREVKYDRSHCRSVFEARLVVSTYCFLGTELLSFDFNYTIYSYILKRTQNLTFTNGSTLPPRLWQNEARTLPRRSRTRRSLQQPLLLQPIWLPAKEKRGRRGKQIVGRLILRILESFTRFVWVQEFW